MAAEPIPIRIYIRVYVSLIVLLVLTVALSFVDIGRHWNNLIAEGIAVAKAFLIVLFFMHVRYGSKLIWFFSAAGVLWLGMMLVLTSSDYLTRNHPQGINAKGEPTYILPRPQNSTGRYEDEGWRMEEGKKAVMPSSFIPTSPKATFDVHFVASPLPPVTTHETDCQC